MVSNIDGCYVTVYVLCSEYAIHDAMYLLTVGGVDIQAEYGDNPFVLGLSQESLQPNYDSIQPELSLS